MSEADIVQETSLELINVIKSNTDNLPLIQEWVQSHIEHIDINYICPNFNPYLIATPFLTALQYCDLPIICYLLETFPPIIPPITSYNDDINLAFEVRLFPAGQPVLDFSTSSPSVETIRHDILSYYSHIPSLKMKTSSKQIISLPNAPDWVTTYIEKSIQIEKTSHRNNSPQTSAVNKLWQFTTPHNIDLNGYYHLNQGYLFGLVSSCNRNQTVNVQFDPSTEQLSAPLPVSGIRQHDSDKMDTKSVDIRSQTIEFAPIVDFSFEEYTQLPAGIRRVIRILHHICTHYRDCILINHQIFDMMNELSSVHSTIKAIGRLLVAIFCDTLRPDYFIATIDNKSSSLVMYTLQHPIMSRRFDVNQQRDAQTSWLYQLSRTVSGRSSILYVLQHFYSRITFEFSSPCRAGYLRPMVWSYGVSRGNDVPSALLWYCHDAFVSHLNRMIYGFLCSVQVMLREVLGWDMDRVEAYLIPWTSSIQQLVTDLQMSSSPSGSETTSLCHNSLSTSSKTSSPSSSSLFSSDNPPPSLLHVWPPSNIRFSTPNPALSVRIADGVHPINALTIQRPRVLYKLLCASLFANAAYEDSDQTITQRPSRPVKLLPPQLAAWNDNDPAHKANALRVAALASNIDLPDNENSSSLSPQQQPIINTNTMDDDININAPHTRRKFHNLMASRMLRQEARRGFAHNGGDITHPSEIARMSATGRHPLFSAQLYSTDNTASSLPAAQSSTAVLGTSENRTTSTNPTTATTTTTSNPTISSISLETHEQQPSSSISLPPLSTCAPTIPTTTPVFEMDSIAHILPNLRLDPMQVSAHLPTSAGDIWGTVPDTPGDDANNSISYYTAMVGFQHVRVGGNGGNHSPTRTNDHNQQDNNDNDNHNNDHNEHQHHLMISSGTRQESRRVAGFRFAKLPNDGVAFRQEYAAQPLYYVETNQHVILEAVSLLFRHVDSNRVDGSFSLPQPQQHELPSNHHNHHNQESQQQQNEQRGNENFHINSDISHRLLALLPTVDEPYEMEVPHATKYLSLLYFSLPTNFCVVALDSYQHQPELATFLYTCAPQLGQRLFISPYSLFAAIRTCHTPCFYVLSRLVFNRFEQHILPVLPLLDPTPYAACAQTRPRLVRQIIFYILSGFAPTTAYIRDIVVERMGQLFDLLAIVRAPELTHNGSIPCVNTVSGLASHLYYVNQDMIGGFVSASRQHGTVGIANHHDNAQFVVDLGLYKQNVLTQYMALYTQSATSSSTSKRSSQSQSQSQLVSSYIHEEKEKEEEEEAKNDENTNNNNNNNNFEENDQFCDYNEIVAEALQIAENPTPERLLQFIAQQEGILHQLRVYSGTYHHHAAGSEQSDDQLRHLMDAFIIDKAYIAYCLARILTSYRISLASDNITISAMTECVLAVIAEESQAAMLEISLDLFIDHCLLSDQAGPVPSSPYRCENHGVGEQWT